MEHNNEIGRSEIELSEKEIEEKKKKRSALPIFFVVLAIFISVVSCFLYFDSIKKIGKSAINAYSAAKNDKIEEVCNQAYNDAYNNYEQEYHVSNQSFISVESVKRAALLEVLKVEDVEFVVEGNIWLQVSGDGIFSVDLTKSEIIVDSSRNTVFVRIPKPTLSNVKSKEYTPLLYEEKESILKPNKAGIGEEQADKMALEGDEKIKDYFKSNSLLFDNAKKAAEKVVVSLIKNMNSRNPNLNVEIEFIN